MVGATSARIPVLHTRWLRRRLSLLVPALLPLLPALGHPPPSVRCPNKYPMDRPSVAALGRSSAS